MIRGLRKLNKLFEILKSLFTMTEEELENTELEIKNIEKVEVKPAEKVEEKEEKKTDTADTKSKDVVTQTLVVNENKDGEETVDIKEYKALQAELKAMKEMMEATQAERVAEKRAAKIKIIKDCVDYDVLTSLLDGVEDKDIDAKVAEIQKEKGYLFKAKETDGFNPAIPQKTLTGVEAEFYKLNPDLRPGLN